MSFEIVIALADTGFNNVNENLLLNFEGIWQMVGLSSKSLSSSGLVKCIHKVLLVLFHMVKYFLANHSGLFPDCIWV